ncbi:MAG: CoA ester lyase [Gammaproteobacteria bacterium]
MTPESSLRLRRSALYVPGSNARALAKAATLPADVLILDLEDAVLPEAKVAARDGVRALVEAGAFGQREVIVRINGPETPWGPDDLRAAAGCGADGILLPKVEHATTVTGVARSLEQLGAAGNLRLWVMAETPRGVLGMAAITGASPRLAAVVVGTADLAKALRLPGSPGREGLQTALEQCVLAARASGLDILDGVFADLADNAGFLAECRQGRLLGFDGKTVIHPGQISPANEAFGVSADEARAAAELIAGWEAAGAGVALVNGRMVERLHVDEARRRLALHRAGLEAMPP